MGLWHYSHYRLGEFSRRPFAVAAHEIADDRSRLRRWREHGPRQGQGNPPLAEDPTIRSPLDAPEPVGERPDHMDAARSERLYDRYPPTTCSLAARRVQAGIDSVRPGGSRRGGGSRGDFESELPSSVPVQSHAARN